MALVRRILLHHRKLMVGRRVRVMATFVIHALLREAGEIVFRDLTLELRLHG